MQEWHRKLLSLTMILAMTFFSLGIPVNGFSDESAQPAAISNLYVKPAQSTAAWASEMTRAYIPRTGGVVTARVFGTDLLNEDIQIYIDDRLEAKVDTSGDDTTFYVDVMIPGNTTGGRVEYILTVELNGVKNASARVIVRTDDDPGFYRADAWDDAASQAFVEEMKAIGKVDGMKENVSTAYAYPTYTKDTVYATRNGVNLKMQRIIPAGTPPDGGWPCIVYVPGSAWSPQLLYSALTDLEQFAKRGYLVASIEYVPAYGAAVTAAFPEQILDAKLAVQYVKEQANVNENKVILMGDSSGGHTAVLAGVTGNDALTDDIDGDFSVAAIVDLYGPNQFAEMSYYPSFLGHNAEASPEGMLLGGVVVTDPANTDKVAEASPMTYLNAGNPTPPTLIMHGDADFLVPFNQSVRLYAEYRKFGKDVEFYKIAGASHGGGHFWAEETLDLIDGFMQSAINGTRPVPRPADDTIEIAPRYYAVPTIWGFGDGQFPTSAEAPGGMEILNVIPAMTHVFTPDVVFATRKYGDGTEKQLKLQIHGNGVFGTRIPCVLYGQGAAWNESLQLPTTNFGRWAEFAQRGFAVVLYDQMGATTQTLQGEYIGLPFPEQEVNAKLAIQYLKKNASLYGIDPDQIVIWGDSSGAHTAVSAGITGDDFAIDDTLDPLVSSKVMAIVDYNGPTDIEFMNYYPSVLTHTFTDAAACFDTPFGPFCMPPSPDPEAGKIGKNDVLDNPDLAAMVSPGTYITPERKDEIPPVLIMQGDLDSLVHFSQSVRLYNQLKNNGNYVEFYREIGGTHSSPNMFNPDRMDVVEAFIRAQLPALPALLGATPAASVEKLNGNQNNLTVTVTETYSDGATKIFTKTLKIDNNAAGEYTVGNYKVYVDTKGNTQVRACYIVEPV